jgi:hypothetical protein
MATNSNMLSLALKDYIPTSSVEKADRMGWVNFGVENLFPQYLRELSETSPVHGSLCISIGDMIAGKRITTQPQYQERTDALKVYEAYYGCSHDLKKYGGFYIELIYSIDGTAITSINHIPFEECRIAVEGEDEIPVGVYHSNDWALPKKKRNKPEYIPKFNPLTSRSDKRQIYWSFNHTSGQIYPRPDYWSSINYIELSKQIGIYHVNNIMNGLFPSFIVNFYNGALDEEAQRAMQRDWERSMSGARNAGKFIMTFNEREQPKTEITPFPISDAESTYEFLSTESRNEIMIAHRVTTPLLFGIREQQGFGSNKDEMAVGLEIFTNQVIEPAQRKLNAAFTEVLQFEMEGLELKVVPNTPLSPTVAPELKAAPKTLAAPLKTLKEASKIEVPTMTELDSQYWLERLKGRGEIVDLEEWDLLDEREARGHEEAIAEHNRFAEIELSVAGYSAPDKKSRWGDSGLYKLRYAYSKNITEDSRPFCKEMVTLSNLGYSFRYEDIVRMSEAGVNGQFAPQGESTYDIFEWKGGCYCHHKWIRQIYFRKRGKGGKFLPNDGLNNDVRVGNVPFVPQKGVEGVPPIETTTKGSLKNS